jgi:catechol 2,3-dioxygenase-like lactoylglutathione lyase family enzyme
MFQPRAAMAAMPAQDFERAKRFYADVLGLTPVEDTEQGARYRVGETEFLLFPSVGKASGDHTQLGLDVDDLEASVKTLRDRGVTFEEYEMPGFKTVGGIFEAEGMKGAWFKDSEGNLLALAESQSGADER